MAHVKQSRPDPGRGFRPKVIVFCSTAGVRKHRCWRVLGEQQGVALPFSPSLFRSLSLSSLSASLYLFVSHTHTHTHTSLSPTHTHTPTPTPTSTHPPTQTHTHLLSPPSLTDVGQDEEDDEVEGHAEDVVDRRPHLAWIERSAFSKSRVTTRAEDAHGTTT